MARKGKTNRKVTIDNFAEAIMDELSEYGDYIDQTVVKNAVHKTAEETAEIVAAAAPVRTGAYKGSITYGEPKRSGRKYTETVYADAPHYRLTHLLERSHATRNGGRSAAFPHWKNGASDLIARFIKNLKELL